jgi:RimJ/RimL family protein N-acetyltransferase
MLGDMQLTTPRLVLREFVADDWLATNEYERIPEVVRYASHGVRSLEASRQRVLDSMQAAEASPRVLFDLAITLAGHGPLIGRCGFGREGHELAVGELWFIANPQWWGRGYVTEAMREVVRFGFEELGLRRFFGNCDPRNPASARVMERLGMVREAHLRENAWYQGEWTDAWIYGLLRREWEALPQRSTS